MNFFQFVHGQTVKLLHSFVKWAEFETLSVMNLTDFTRDGSEFASIIVLRITITKRIFYSRMEFFIFRKNR